jgi:glutamate-1-semialdehyde aminotransferase/acyl carrier protein
MSTLPRLIDLAIELTGMERDAVAPTVPLVELGFDSLVMTQLAQQLRAEFGLDVSFREFFTTLRTLAAVAERIGERAPAPAPAASATSADGATPARDATTLARDGGAPAAPTAALAEVLRRQLEVLERQLDLLSGSAPAAAQPTTATATDQAAVRRSEPAPPPPAVPAVPVVPKAPLAAAAEPGAGADGPTPLQEAEVMRITAEWCARTAGSKERTARHRPYLADPRTAAGFNARWKEIVYPLVVERSRGPFLWDVDGNRYVDLLNGFGPGFFGHSAPFIAEAIQAQLDAGFEIGPQTPLTGEAAQLVCELTGLDRAAFVCTGSEAVMTALRLARTFTGRDRVVVFGGAYHGNFDEVLVRGAGLPRALPAAPGIPRRAVTDVTVLEYGSERSLAEIRKLAPELAAVLVEPVQSRRPELQPREFLQELRAITRAAGVVLIFDEVVTGFRCHPGGAQAVFGIEADLVTYGKVLGGGLPVGVVAGRRPFVDVLDGGPWSYGDDSMPTQGVTFSAGTFVRHPLAMAATHAALRYLKTAGEALQSSVNARTADLVRRLGEIATAAGAPIQIPHFCSIMYFRCTDPRNEFNSFFFHLMRQHGIYMLEGFPSYLTLAHGDAEVDAVVAAFRDVVERMQRATFWPAAPREGARAPVATDDARLRTPPAPGARLGRDRDGSAAWFVEDPERPGAFIRVG